MSSDYSSGLVIPDLGIKDAIIQSNQKIFLLSFINILTIFIVIFFIYLFREKICSIFGLCIFND